MFKKITKFFKAYREIEYYKDKCLKQEKLIEALKNDNIRLEGFLSESKAIYNYQVGVLEDKIKELKSTKKSCSVGPSSRGKRGKRRSTSSSKEVPA